ncbi:PadR family transcriptional regulator [Acidithiobacillus ferriphilus]|uniref:PadR family transcriptional regulator n=1 Tax=Acidithiobacillus ferriphilus TaxID=1689834 RepID=UPI001C078F51|nr:helix-turn-helix transcriptional regulator [Acidithiobacillus ferriphilus]MBU2830140.1 PadR family transcriptional regulator [Acidithiobacillus ferriphilus]WCE94339.1 helix-turn-helix transcriptional regulator [Acidithiobacillus ferriphilus]
MSNDRVRPGRHLAAFSLLLLWEMPDHGLHLHRRINGVLPDGLQVDIGNLYRALRDLEVRGSVQSAWDTEGSGSARRIYRITADGHDELRGWSEDISKRRSAFDWFLGHWQALAESDGNVEARLHG